jgi:hypothetical protein
MTSELQAVEIEGRLLGLESAATYLDTTTKTISRLITRGVLTPVRIPTLRRVFFDREDLDRLINAGKVPAPNVRLGGEPHVADGEAGSALSLVVHDA